jgi:pimeloyl-ACP methyl ester carboxylesterase
MSRRPAGRAPGRSQTGPHPLGGSADVPVGRGAPCQQFVQVGERRVFVRCAGSGPAVVLVHQSPESSVSLLPWFDTLGRGFAVFAPDTPGFGLSDPLPLAQPTIPDLAEALGRLLDALGLHKVLLYGVHTGAAIAARLARDRPALVAALVCDGLSAFTAEERRPLLDGYLPPFEPAWDGTHLLWLWARMREQKLFFPWQAGTAAARIPYPLPTPQQIHKEAMELLDAGDGYRAGYRAPLLYEHGAAGAAQIEVPAALLYRRADVLRPHLDRLPALPPNVAAREVADADALAVQTLALFQHHAAFAAAVDSTAAVAGAAAPGRRVVTTPLGPLAFWCAGPLPSSAAVVDLVIGEPGVPAAIPPSRAPGASMLAIELPGHGATPRWPVAAIDSGAWLGAVIAALDALGVCSLRVHGEAGGAGLARALAAGLQTRCIALSTAAEPALDAPGRARFLAGLPALEPVASGAHFIEAWNWARLRRLFEPGREPDAAAALRVAAPPPRRVHGEVVEMLRAGDNFAALWRAALPP